MATFLGGSLGGVALVRAAQLTEFVISAVRQGTLKCVVMLLTAQQRASERHALSSLDDRMLQDIGLTQVDVARETAKRFWES